MKSKKRKRTKKKKQSIFTPLMILIVLTGVAFVLYKCNRKPRKIKENIELSASDYIFGIDISHYQGKIDWEEMNRTEHPIEFVFIRASMGVDGKDTQFGRNWEHAEEYGFVRGAYHYFRPNENASQQFENYKRMVQLKEGDFIPILDVEKKSPWGKEKLREGVAIWLKLAEKHYGTKPMIYTGLDFYLNNLKGFFDGYPLWIAAYTKERSIENTPWLFYQFTEDLKVTGIQTSVDGNYFKGSSHDLYKMCLD